MPVPEFSIDNPSPDRGHEAIRRAVKKAIADLTDTQADSDDSFYLVDVAFELLDGALAQIDALTQRVAALEADPPT